jgi:hypothetical protein
LKLWSLRIGHELLQGSVYAGPQIQGVEFFVPATLEVKKELHTVRSVVAQDTPYKHRAAASFGAEHGDLGAQILVEQEPMTSSKSAGCLPISSLT